MRNLEFHQDYRTGQATYKRTDDNIVHELTEKDGGIIDFLLDMSETFYPDQYAAVSEVYKNSSPNTRYYNFLRARRIANCGFGENDSQADIDEFGLHHFEYVKCPLMAECKHYRIICLPKFQSKLSKAELVVMEKVFHFLSPEQIADELHLSIHTVNNHRKNALRRLKCRTTAEFIDFAHRTNLFTK